MRWYADNSDVFSRRGAKIPDIVLMGGIAVRASEVKPLQQALESVKKKHGAARAPVKWNMKDLREDYEAFGHGELFNRLLATSAIWRREMFEAANNFDVKIIVGCVESYSVRRKPIMQNKAALNAFAFCNALMRYALHVQEQGKEDPESDVVLDWPVHNESSPFDQEYQAAYNKGTALDSSLSYHSGPLKDLNFADSIRYTPTCHSTLLQFADLVAGATRDFIHLADGKTTNRRGLELLKVVKSKVRGYPGAPIVGRGICVHGEGGRLATVVRHLAQNELN